MKISINWLKDYLEIKERPEKLAEVLTMSTAEVEEVQHLGQGLDKIVVGEIFNVKTHPNADKLRLALVNIGTQRLSIVCGAPNIKPGQKVPVALVGARLATGLEIKEAKIGGIESHGMLCAEDELGLGEDHEGILILPTETKVGQDLKKALGLDDVVLDIENKSLTHRPDLFSHLGIARELAVLTKKKLKQAKLTSKKYTSPKKSWPLKVMVKDTKLCPRYMGVVLNNIKIASSPRWLQSRLRAVGLRPINNVVDITNYVMMEYGQPLHAFDAEKVAGQTIVVRRAKKGETLQTLDGESRKLDDNILVIADKEKPIALAGIMGGANAEINANTKTIIIESANFDPVNTRKAAWQLGLRTEAVTRFEKGLPLPLVELAINRVLELLIKETSAKVASKIIDQKSATVSNQLKQKSQLLLDLSYLNKVIGLVFDSEVAQTRGELKVKQVNDILKSLGFQVTKSKKDEIKVQVPWYRNDIQIPEDLIEEVARVYGYNNIPPTPIVGEFAPVAISKEDFIEEEIKDVLVGVGFTEVRTYSFYGENTLKRLNLNPDDHIRLANPLNPDQTYLRINLLPNLLRQVRDNLRHQEKFQIFELGSLYLGQKIEDGLPAQPKVLAAIIVGKNPKRVDQHIFFQAKGAVEFLLTKLNVNKKAVYTSLEKEQGALLTIEDKPIGKIRVIDEQLKQSFKIKNSDVVAITLDVERLFSLAESVKLYKPIPIYPKVVRDLSMVLAKKINNKQVVDLIKQTNSLIIQVDLFDIFEDKRFGPDKRSLAYRIIYQSPDRTLKDAEVNRIQQEIIKGLESNLGAQVRTIK